MTQTHATKKRQGDSKMRNLISLIPYVLLATSMAAALTVVFVATLKILVRSFHRATAIVLALGVTILAVVGTTQIIIIGPQPGGPTLSPVPSGNALMLLPFVTWAIASLLAQLLAAAGATVLEQEPEPTGNGSGTQGPEVQPNAEPQKNATTDAKPRGRPRKPSPDASSQEPPNELKKKPSSPKQSQPAATDVAGKHKIAGAAGPAEQP
jgi:hypothetical protein